MARIPPGWHTLTPRIITPDPEGLVAFLQQVFGATGEYQAGAPTEVWIGDSVVMVSSGEGHRDAMPAFFYVYVDDADATYREAIAACAESMEEPRDLPYGDRRAMVRDAWGNLWQIATRLAD
jgi:uncharacterized glyoxalase superfamily protein PhnB